MSEDQHEDQAGRKHWIQAEGLQRAIVHFISAHLHPPDLTHFHPPKRHISTPKEHISTPKKTHFIPPLRCFQRTKTTKLKVKVNVFAAQVHVEELVVAHIEQNLTMCNAKLG